MPARGSLDYSILRKKSYHLAYRQACQFRCFAKGSLSPQAVRHFLSQKKSAWRK